MRATGISSDGKLKVRAIAGTHVVLLALDLPKADTKDLKGFAFRRRVAGGSWAWLTGLKIFEDLFPNGVKVSANGKLASLFADPAAVG